MMRRMGLWALLLAVLVWGPPVKAASLPIGGKAEMEMVVVMPEPHYLAVYQQWVMNMAQPVTVGILTGARSLSGYGGRIAATGNGYAVVQPNGTKFAVRYEVAWNGQSASLAIPAYETTNALVILTPTSLTVPSVLNPSLAPAGKGRIPGIPHSPVFYEYATTNVAQGQTVPLVIERAGSALAANPGLYQGTGNHPGWGTGFLLAIGLVALGGVALALNWKPVTGYHRRRYVREQLVSELAILEASYRRGEIAEDAYRAERQTLLSALAAIGDGQAVG
ncbi:hypothetical protein TPY_3400 [Sulfobacillus acidophilus TPY]|uniref:SHOCT domain-containing protein n=1 Tax=Sulfobacillus acidophilus (strain ATCC 700253 / DSM 10332 / NAL) TaxID=679936 RepID=G8TXQ4_SULAD|nr:hypothetical protein TPY_3400 [Sulfobacillus acidophilus TPY]AEW05010.1 hypothetical protein Sulac_1513 [Sulfobacillus acidophilus DSM 10332]